MEQLIMSLAGIGALLSLYTLSVERKLAHSPHARAFCDFNDHMSCTRAFASEYGKTFGISNGALGLAYYLVILAIAVLASSVESITSLLLYLTAAGVLGSCYFAYNLFFKLKDYCVVCMSVYAVNIALFLVQVLR